MFAFILEHPILYSAVLFSMTVDVVVKSGVLDPLMWYFPTPNVREVVRQQICSAVCRVDDPLELAEWDPALVAKYPQPAMSKTVTGVVEQLQPIETEVESSGPDPMTSGKPLLASAGALVLLGLLSATLVIHKRPEGETDAADDVPDIPQFDLVKSYAMVYIGEHSKAIQVPLAKLISSAIYVDSGTSPIVEVLSPEAPPVIPRTFRDAGTSPVELSVVSAPVTLSTPPGIPLPETPPGMPRAFWDAGTSPLELSSVVSAPVTPSTPPATSLPETPPVVPPKFCNASTSPIESSLPVSIPITPSTPPLAPLLPPVPVTPVRPPRIARGALAASNSSVDVVVLGSPFDLDRLIHSLQSPSTPEVDSPMRKWVPKIPRLEDPLPDRYRNLPHYDVAVQVVLLLQQCWDEDRFRTAEKEALPEIHDPKPRGLIPGIIYSHPMHPVDLLQEIYRRLRQLQYDLAKRGQRNTFRDMSWKEWRDFDPEAGPTPEWGRVPRRSPSEICDD